MQTATDRSAETTLPKPRKTSSRAAAKTDPPTSRGNVKATIVMSRKLNFLLTTIAGYREMDRSTLARQLIEEGLKRDQPDLFKANEKFHPEKARKAKSDGTTHRPEDADDSSEESSAAS